MRIFTPAVVIAALTTLLIPSIASSQVRQNWQQSFALPPGYLLAIEGWTTTDASGNIIIAGVFYPNLFTQASDLAVYKYNSSGSLAWSNVFVSGGVASSAVGLTTDAAGNIYVLFNNTAGTPDIPNGAQLMKYSPGGTLNWSQAMPSNSTIVVTAMTADAAGNVYVTGSNNDDYITLKYNTAGTLLWTAAYNGTASGNDIARAIALDAAGNVYVTGSSPGQETLHYIGLRGGGGTLTINTGNDIATVKYDPSGNTLWTARYNGSLTGNDNANAMALDPASGNVYIVGQSFTSSTVEVGDLLAYSSSGSQLWTYQDTQAYNTIGIGVDPSGNPITNENSAGGQAFLIRKFSSSGSITWTFPYGLNVPSYSGGPHYMALDKQGNIYTSAYEQTATGATAIATTQITSSGQQSWQIFNTSSTNGISGLTVFTPISRFGQIVYPEVDVSYITSNEAINTVQYQQTPGLKLLSTTADSLDGLGVTLAPTAAQLSNYPNPFRGATTIAYTLPQNSHVTLQVYDGAGHPVATLVDEDKTAGSYTLPFSAGRLAAGIYVYRIVAQSPQGSFIQTKQMIIQ